MLSLRQQWTIRSSKCLWDLCFHVGQGLTSRLTVEAGGPPANVPATNLVLVLDRSGLAMITDRMQVEISGLVCLARDMEGLALAYLASD
ncbi:hypothetical protein PIB30_022527 [Stylosanthes scabra]|uniref:Uncharacterized protein n=1 Tax=Stylosanthes scabra TaxID=79078 RepID=A0ABU6W7P1_9FABA|nr:hypothetical protein [Stylosanthes scabra]